MLKNGYYIPENDIVQNLPDGRQTLLAAKGVPIAEAEARRLGYIKDGEAGPSEIKAELASELASELAGAPAVEPPKADVPVAGDPVLAIGSNATKTNARKKVNGS